MARSRGLGDVYKRQVSVGSFGISYVGRIVGQFRQSVKNRRASARKKPAKDFS
jgi:hypothetical protein